MIILKSKESLTVMSTNDSIHKYNITEATLESTGIPSGAVMKVIRELEDKRLPMHSLLILRHGELVHESYWKPFCRERKHRLYSVSKSFVSLAIGIMADEGRISLNDPVVKYFPEYVPADADEFLTRATIRDMLMMTDCHMEFNYSDGNEWLKAWFDEPVSHPAGAVFSYATICTNLCCTIVEKLSGMDFIDYLYPRMLDPVGASKGIKCIKMPDGYSFGGSGVLATPLDLALVAQLCMNKGNWQGNQLISEGFILEATAAQVDTSVACDVIDEQQGYGYQFWRTRYNGFACYGMGSQYAICLPDHDMVIVITADTQGYTNAGYIIHEAIFTMLLPSLSDEPLPDDPSAQKVLSDYTSSLGLPLVQGELFSKTADRVSGTKYHFRDNPMNIKSVRFEFSGDEAVMTYEKPNGVHKLCFGIGKLIEQSFPETHYSGMQIRTPAGYGYECRAGAGWVKENCLRAKVYITDDYFGSFDMNVVFIGDEVTVIMKKIAEDFLHDYQGTATGKRID